MNEREKYEDTKFSSNVYNINFSEDGSYHAYECFGDVEIGNHYTKVLKGISGLRFLMIIGWLTISILQSMSMLIFIDPAILDALFIGIIKEESI